MPDIIYRGDRTRLTLENGRVVFPNEITTLSDEEYEELSDFQANMETVGSTPAQAAKPASNREEKDS